MNKIPLHELQNILKTNQGIFIQGIGFDKRCLTILQNITISQFSTVIGIQNLHSKSKKLEHESKFLELAGKKALIVGENSRNVIDIVDNLSDQFSQIDLSDKEIFFDITSLSHEILVVVVGLLNELDLLKNTNFLYTQANQYGEWLSKGVNEIRSILGFSGLMYPSKKLHLIILLGFELERAESVIKSFEPARLTLGIGKKDQSVSNEIFNINNKTKNKIEDLIFSSGLDIENIDNMEFSCLDPYLTENGLLNYINRLDNRDEYNIVIVPLNNKISTLGVALACLKNQDLQISYAEAEEYNYENYAVSNDLISFFKLI
ncbi:hypothetical protein [Acinetobacter sp. ANC 4173]|uniref:hypothetical protein n=1 Tax=Acinetobacter sp. ANC 4173 TaxID=2529837 RepID=UPI00103A0893|nr:hypothetical protein [Acinetobacter sp. ANC 4173]TCB78433.1 hypothetical protein E0H94_12045 [Acinetobacter sp. ANC 4173]